MERHELHDKIVQQLRFHRISGLDEEECANNILSIVQADWTQGCSCYEGDKTGETWCCNKCGKPTSTHTSRPDKLQKTEHILEVVKKMREAQRNYFKNRTTPASKRYLHEAKTLEKQVDVDIFELNAQDEYKRT